MPAWLDELMGALASGGQGNPNMQDLNALPDPATLEQMKQGAGGLVAGMPGGIRDLGEVGGALMGMSQGQPFPMAEREMDLQAPGTTDWFGEKMGMDVDSPEFIAGSMFSPDPFGKVGAMAGAAIPLIGRVAKNLDEGSDLAAQLGKIADRAKVQKDYENDVSFIEMDTVDPSVDARIKTTGQYRGAPKGVDKPQRLGKMRRDLWGMLETGAPGRNWYEQSAKMTTDLTGGRPNYKHLAAGANAITSRGAAVPANRVFGVRGNNQAIMGRPVDAGRFPTAQGAAIEELASGKTYYGGPKETPFYEGLTIDERTDGIRPTNDLWMARAFGYTRPDGSEWGEGLGRAQHRFMDKEIKHLVQKANEAELGGFNDWTAEKVQAAIWVAKKAEMEGTTVGKASEDFSHGLDNLTGNIRYEAYPSKSLDHMQEYGQSDQYMDIVKSLTEDDAGRNIMALEAGALTRPGDRGYGIYEGETSPSASARILMAPKTGSAEIDEASMDLAKGIGAGHGLALGQDTVGITSFRPPKRASDTNIARVAMDDTSPGGMKELEDALTEQFGAGNAFPLHTPEGVEIAYMGDDGSAFKKGLKKVLGNDANVEYGQNTGDLVGNTNWDDPGYKPSAWMGEIDAANLGPAEPRLERGVQQLAGLMDESDTALEAAGMGTKDEILTLTRQILSKEGFAGVRKAVEAGILPAVVLTMLGGGVASMGGNEQPGAL